MTIAFVQDGFLVWPNGKKLQSVTPLFWKALIMLPLQRLHANAVSVALTIGCNWWRIVSPIAIYNQNLQVTFSHSTGVDARSSQSVRFRVAAFHFLCHFLAKRMSIMRLLISIDYYGALDMAFGKSHFAYSKASITCGRCCGRWWTHCFDHTIQQHIQQHIQLHIKQHIQQWLLQNNFRRANGRFFVYRTIRVPVELPQSHGLWRAACKLAHPHRTVSNRQDALDERSLGSS